MAMRTVEEILNVDCGCDRGLHFDECVREIIHQVRHEFGETTVKICQDNHDDGADAASAAEEIRALIPTVDKGG